jgi:hypothetical protein
MLPSEAVKAAPANCRSSTWLRDTLECPVTSKPSVVWLACPDELNSGAAEEICGQVAGPAFLGFSSSKGLPYMGASARPGTHDSKRAPRGRSSRLVP